MRVPFAREMVQALQTLFTPSGTFPNPNILDTEIKLVHALDPVNFGTIGSSMIEVVTAALGAGVNNIDFMTVPATEVWRLYGVSIASTTGNATAFLELLEPFSGAILGLCSQNVGNTMPAGGGLNTTVNDRLWAGLPFPLHLVGGSVLRIRTSGAAAGEILTIDSYVFRVPRGAAFAY